MNEPRQLMSVIRAATSGGVTVLPNREQACVIPWAQPRLTGAVQLDMARVAVGNVAPSPNPRKNRPTSNLTKPPTKPVATVAPAQTTAQTANVRRAPNRSLSQPP